MHAIVEGDLFLSARSSSFFLLCSFFFFLLSSSLTQDSCLKIQIFVGKSDVLGRARCALGGTKSRSSINCLTPLFHDMCFSFDVASGCAVFVVLTHQLVCLPQAQCRNSIWTQTSVQGSDFCFSTTVRYGMVWYGMVWTH